MMQAVWFDEFQVMIICQFFSMFWKWWWIKLSVSHTLNIVTSLSHSIPLKLQCPPILKQAMPFIAIQEGTTYCFHPSTIKQWCSTCKGWQSKWIHLLNHEENLAEKTTRHGGKASGGVEFHHCLMPIGLCIQLILSCVLEEDKFS